MPRVDGLADSDLEIVQGNAAAEFFRVFRPVAIDADGQGSGDQEWFLLSLVTKSNLISPLILRMSGGLIRR